MMKGVLILATVAALFASGAFSSKSLEDAAKQAGQCVGWMEGAVTGTFVAAGLPTAGRAGEAPNFARLAPMYDTTDGALRSINVDTSTTLSEVPEALIISSAATVRMSVVGIYIHSQGSYSTAGCFKGVESPDNTWIRIKLFALKIWARSSEYSTALIPELGTWQQGPGVTKHLLGEFRSFYDCAVAALTSGELDKAVEYGPIVYGAGDQRKAACNTINVRDMSNIRAEDYREQKPNALSPDIGFDQLAKTLSSDDMPLYHRLAFRINIISGLRKSVTPAVTIAMAGATFEGCLRSVIGNAQYQMFDYQDDTGACRMFAGYDGVYLTLSSDKTAFVPNFIRQKVAMEVRSYGSAAPFVFSCEKRAFLPYLQPQ